MSVIKNVGEIAPLLTSENVEVNPFHTISWEFENNQYKVEFWRSEPLIELYINGVESDLKSEMIAGMSNTSFIEKMTKEYDIWKNYKPTPTLFQKIKKWFNKS